eukprot:TRINITY_DN12076_c0_g1_i6.p1 TRINITY_DN12076_c0_g1~~TRINITY_DN12076_c0_g1_i6.p1  ORF type:complete len:311 (+),score=-37.45 TRINITY_DN12076_c0_g1_i6:171-1103(+)
MQNYIPHKQNLKSLNFWKIFLRATGVCHSRTMLSQVLSLKSFFTRSVNLQFQTTLNKIQYLLQYMHTTVHKSKYYVRYKKYTFLFNGLLTKCFQNYQKITNKTTNENITMAKHKKQQNFEPSIYYYPRVLSIQNFDVLNRKLMNVTGTQIMLINIQKIPIFQLKQKYGQQTQMCMTIHKIRIMSVQQCVIINRINITHTKYEIKITLQTNSQSKSQKLQQEKNALKRKKIEKKYVFFTQDIIRVILLQKNKSWNYYQIFPKSYIIIQNCIVKNITRKYCKLPLSMAQIKQQQQQWYITNSYNIRVCLFYK